MLGPGAELETCSLQHHLNFPSANIFLEDGRSLLDCQLQMKEKSIVRNTRKRSPLLKKRSHLGTNDNVCSVCHYGGELLLCDECPSSFHTGCLGMKVSFCLSLLSYLCFFLLPSPTQQQFLHYFSV